MDFLCPVFNRAIKHIAQQLKRDEVRQDTAAKRGEKPLFDKPLEQTYVHAEGTSGLEKAPHKVNICTVHEDGTMGLLWWSGSELRSDGFSNSEPSAQFVTTRSDDYSLPITDFSQQSTNGKCSMLAVQKSDNGQLKFTLIPASERDSSGGSVVTSFSEIPHGDAEQITLQIAGQAMTLAVPNNNEVVKVVDARDSSALNSYD